LNLPVQNIDVDKLEMNYKMTDEKLANGFHEKLLPN